MIDWTLEPNEGDPMLASRGSDGPMESCDHGDACDLVLTDRGDTLVCCL